MFVSYFLKHVQGVCHIYGLAIYIKKYLFKAKEEELWKLKYLFHHPKIDLIFPKKNPLKKPKSFKIYYNSIINLKFQHKPLHYLVGAKIP
jgi:hypothetical protein